MIPQTGWSSDVTTITPFATYGINRPFYASKNPYELELGPLVLSASGGDIAAAWWLFEYKEGAVYAARYNQTTEQFEAETLIVTVPEVKRLSATFDQLGRPLVFFDTGTDLKLYWFDPVLDANTITEFGEGKYPFATFDIRWDTSNPRSDVMLIYIRDGGIYYRLQRDRYNIEHATPVTADVVFIKEADMAIDYRMQLVYRAQDKGFAPPPAVPPVVAPTQGAWHYLLSGYQSYVDTRAIALQLMQPFSVTLTLAQFEPAAATVCLWSQQQHPQTGQLALCFTGANFDVLRLLYGGSWFEAKLPFGLCAGTWRTEVLWRGNGYGLLVTHTARDGVVSQGGVIIGRFDPTVQSGGAMLRLGAMNGFGGEAIHCLRAAISDVRITPHAQAPELRIAMTKKPQHSDLQAITLGDGSASGLGDALISGYRDANWLFMPG